ncbi:hypothetical protein ACHAXH_002251 [Discostella pseudostelligera]
MFRQGLEEIAILLISSNVNDLILPEKFFGDIIPIMCGNFHLLVLKVTPPNMHGRKGRLGTTGFLCFLLQSSDNFPSSTIDGVTVVQKITHKPLVVMIDFRIREVHKCVKMIQ